MRPPRRIGILTGGGDAPGLNAAIRAVVRKALAEGMEVVGFRRGWLGVLGGDYLTLDRDAVRGILPLGGTILGTSRTDPVRDGGLERIRARMKALDLDGLIVLGGDGTLRATWEVARAGVPVVGIPKTIDNDVAGTDATIGFHTAATLVADALDRLHPTAEAHHRVFVVETMGRGVGWIAALGGLAGGADVVLVPEVPYTVGEVVERLRRRHRGGRDFSIVVVAEDSWPQDLPRPDRAGVHGEAGVGHVLAHVIQAETGYETRAIVLGHLQRGGSPTLFDRVLATRMGVLAVDLVREGRFGTMTALRGGDVVPVPLEEVVGRRKPLDLEFYRLTHLFG